ncbi:UDP-glycosyltransferase UGT5-like [Microplitis mediator]|uniref:UDP-glycosyltransferase UGT5-like n=1 Tax=Microplitis mediator TaxID=375433 RepID=UPI002556A261|nr:UDP-glycosyltransferase UGT5-like [Microplitis mediator]
MMGKKLIFIFTFFFFNYCTAYNVLLATMGGTKSHTVPFVALGTALRIRGHNVTLVSAFPGPAANNGLRELIPPIFEAYVGNYTSEWDLVGSRFRNELPLSPWDAMRYGWESCEALLRDESSVAALRRPDISENYESNSWDVAILDGAFPECLLGILHGENIPTMMLNTVALYGGSMSRQGNPTLWSLTPYFGKGYTQDMNFFQRITNVACLVTLEVMHWIMTTGFIQPTLRKYLGDQVPDVRELVSEVSLTLQNSHYSVAESMPYLPNVVNVACLHCRPAMELSPDLESFLRKGFIFVSMGSSVRASGMPDTLREIFIAAFSTLPFNIIWKWEGSKINNLPSNIRTGAWWPQQELLGHPQLRAFVSHGGLLSLHEAAYHAAPTLVLPVFCDHDGNAAQAEKLGYALVMNLASLSINDLREAILKVTAKRSNPYKEAARRRSILLKDQPLGSNEVATWWVEHVAKHQGAEHLKSPTRLMGVVRYYSVDVLAFYAAVTFIFIQVLHKLLRRSFTKHTLIVKGKID